jgi:hypothetical protein
MSHTSWKNREKSENKVTHARKTHRHRRKDQLVERTTCPRQPTLESVTLRDLLLVIGVVTDLEGGCPRGEGKFEDLGVTTSDISQQGRTRVLPGLLDLC